MKRVTIAQNPLYDFKVEPYQKKVRLIILKEGIELACRKENIKPIYKFIEGADATMFKGRLQLEKRKNTINLLFKKEKVFSIKTSNLLVMLEAATHNISNLK